MKNYKIILSVFVMLILIALTANANTVQNFTLKDAVGSEHMLSDYSDSKAVVVMFISAKCPVSNAYNERMNELYKDYAEKGVQFLGVNANKTETVDDIKSHAKEKKFKFPVLVDKNNVIANQMGANVTPEVFVLSGDMNVLYHGRIDDSQRLNEVKSNDLRSALDAVLAGQMVETSKTKAFGCSIKKVN